MVQKRKAKPGGSAPRAKKGKAVPKKAAKKKPTPKVKAGVERAQPEGTQKKKSSDAKAERQRQKVRKEALTAEIAKELIWLRTCLGTSANALAARLDGEIAHALNAFEGHALPEEKPAIPNVRAQERILAALRGVKLKPEKGRVKDLARIQELTISILCLMPSGA